MKRTFSIFEAKARLSEIIRIVREKHEVIITDRSEPVVRMVPFKSSRHLGIEEHFEDLCRLGQISLAPKKPAIPKQSPLPEGMLRKFLKERE